MLRYFLYFAMLVGVGLEMEFFNSVSLFLREISSRLVIKSFFLCMFLLKGLVVSGKWRLYSVEKSLKKLS